MSDASWPLHDQPESKLDELVVPPLLDGFSDALHVAGRNEKERLRLRDCWALAGDIQTDIQEAERRIRAACTPKAEWRDLGGGIHAAVPSWLQRGKVLREAHELLNQAQASEKELRGHLQGLSVFVELVLSIYSEQLYRNTGQRP